MKTWLGSLFYVVRSLIVSRARLQFEIIALRHQLNVLRQSHRGRIQLNRADRVFWVWLSKVWSGWRSVLVIVKPGTVVAWHRKGFRLFWKWKSKRGPGRPVVSAEVRALIRKMCLANPTWGAPRIHGELLKLGIEVSETTVAKYMPRNRNPPSQTWRAFLTNHAQQLISIDFFVVPTLSFQLLFVFVVLEHHRRRVMHFNVTAHPTAEWTAQQMLEAFPWDEVPRFLIRDRDGCYGDAFQRAVCGMNIKEVLTAPHSPWQNGFVELRSYFRYYERSRTHSALEKDAPERRTIHPPSFGDVVELPEVGGLHHRYERRAA